MVYGFGGFSLYLLDSIISGSVLSQDIMAGSVRWREVAHLGETRKQTQELARDKIHFSKS